MSVKPMCSTCWMRLPNTGTPGVVVHRLVPQLRGDAGVALVAPERVDPQVLTGRELDVHHRRALDVSAAGAMATTSYPRSVSAARTSATDG